MGSDRERMQWALQVSRDVHKAGGKAEAALAAKCRWEARSRTSIILEYGDPRRWGKDDSNG